jgi:hypothetical protein
VALDPMTSRLYDVGRQSSVICQVDEFRRYHP